MNPRLRELPIAAGLQPVLNFAGAQAEAVSLTDWFRYLNAPPPQWTAQGMLPYWLTLKDGIVVQNSEQYLP